MKIIVKFTVSEVHEILREKVEKMGLRVLGITNDEHTENNWDGGQSTIFDGFEVECDK